MEQDSRTRLEGLFHANIELSTGLTVESIKVKKENGTLTSLSVKITQKKTFLTLSASHHTQNGQNFPYVLSPFFEAYTHDTRKRANADVVLYAPVTNDVAGWKNFSALNSGWLEELT